MCPWRSGGGRPRARWRSSRRRGIPFRRSIVEGRTIAKTFWGKAWCDNLERYSDFENRLPRGRTYVRNGSVIDLQIARRRGQSPGQRLGDLQGGGESHPGVEGAMEIHLHGLRRRH